MSTRINHTAAVFTAAVFAATALIMSLTGCSGTRSSHGVENTMPQTYCNPLDLDYGWGSFNPSYPDSRTAADPVIVLFKDKYYLFSTLDISGYRVSDDLMHWKDQSFCSEVAEAALNDGKYTAPAVAADDKYVYYFKLNRNRKEKTVKILRSDAPETGKWEVCGEIRRVSDPSLLIDNGRFFVFHGLGADQSIKCFELDPVTMTEIPGSEHLLLDYIKDIDSCRSGSHFGRREIWDEIEAGPLRGNFNMLPCPEGSWATKVGDKYYLQYATPGTLSIWYCDMLMTSGTADRGYIEQEYSPVSLKAGGFIGGAGHSCVFQDRYGNWWEISSMWVGNRNPFERRLGLFPVSFDKDGRMKVHTYLGDWPMKIPQRKFDPEDCLAGWWNLSCGKPCRASSELEGFPVSNAADENVRTWWAAESGNAGEWFEMDLEDVCDINAFQLNFAEHEPADSLKDDWTSYELFVSKDGKSWNRLIDRRKSTKINPHDYIELRHAVQARYVKVVCHHAMKGCNFAIRDLRVFGKGNCNAPEMVEKVRAVRLKSDERYADVYWTPSPDADGYVVRFGYSPDFLNLSVQVKGGDTDHLGIHILTKGVRYWYAVDAYNSGGITRGEVIDEIN